MLTGWSAEANRKWFEIVEGVLLVDMNQRAGLLCYTDQHSILYRALRQES